MSNVDEPFHLESDAEMRYAQAYAEHLSLGAREPRPSEYRPLDGKRANEIRRRLRQEWYRRTAMIGRRR